MAWSGAEPQGKHCFPCYGTFTSTNVAKGETGSRRCTRYLRSTNAAASLRCRRLKIVHEDVAPYFLNNSNVAAYTLLLHVCSFGSRNSDTTNEITAWVPNWSAKRQEPIYFEVKQAEHIYYDIFEYYVLFDNLS